MFVGRGQDVDASLIGMAPGLLEPEEVLVDAFPSGGNRHGRTLTRLDYRRRFGRFSSGMNTANAITVVQRFGFPIADWVMFWVRTILPAILKTCSRSFHAIFGSNSTPSVVANICAARSSVYSPVSSSVSPCAWCSDRYP